MRGLATAAPGNKYAFSMKLHHAALRGDCAESRRLIAAGEPIDARDDDGETALFVAAAFEQRDAVECLLEHGADVRAGNAAGRTPLHGAAEAGKRAAIELLLAYGADID